VPDSEIRALAFKFNAGYPQRLTLEERDRLIVKMYMEDGKTEGQISEIVKFSTGTISTVLAAEGVDTKRNRKLSRMERIAVVRHLLAEEKQVDIAARIGILGTSAGYFPWNAGAPILQWRSPQPDLESHSLFT